MISFYNSNTKIAADVIEHLIDYEYSFDVFFTSRSTTIVLNDVKILHAEVELSKKALGMIKKLRREVEKRMTSLAQVEQIRNIYYVKESIFKHKRLFEYDLSAAYLHALHDLELCSDDMYLCLLSLTKQERLAVVGSLATKRLKQSYVAGELSSVERETQKTEPAWWAVVHHVNTIMQEYIAQKSAVAYWVDAVWSTKELHIKQEHKQKIVRIVEAKRHKNRIFFALDDGRFFNIPKEDEQ